MSQNQVTPAPTEPLPLEIEPASFLETLERLAPGSGK